MQDQLVRMLSGVTSSMTLRHRLSQLEEQGQGSEEAASLANAYCTVSARQTVGLARELLGGNGILLEEQVGRFVADAEAIYSYEGTREINTLIVGRALTGIVRSSRQCGALTARSRIARIQTRQHFDRPGVLPWTSIPARADIGSDRWVASMTAYRSAMKVARPMLRNREGCSRWASLSSAQGDKPWADIAKFLMRHQCLHFSYKGGQPVPTDRDGTLLHRQWWRLHSLPEDPASGSRQTGEILHNSLDCCVPASGRRYGSQMRRMRRSAMSYEQGRRRLSDLRRKRQTISSMMLRHRQEDLGSSVSSMARDSGFRSSCGAARPSGDDSRGAACDGTAEADRRRYH